MRLNVTPELAVLLKTIRVHNRISSKNLAEHIGKSYSYISKLESGDVKSISSDDLKQILIFVSGGGDFYNDVLPDVVRTFVTLSDSIYIVDQVWLIHYDVIERVVHVTDDIVDDMNNTMKSNRITVDRLVDMINSNLDTETNSYIEENVYFPMSSHGHTRLLIKSHVEYDEISDILSKKQTETHYYVLQYMIYNIIRMVEFPEYTKKLPADQAASILRRAAEYHTRFGTCSLLGFENLLASEPYVSSISSTQNNVVSSLNSVADELILNSVIELCREAISHDPVGATQALDSMQNNLVWDTAFTLKMLSVPFSKLGNLSFRQKKKMLDSIYELFDQFDKLPDIEKRYEAY